MKKEHELAIKVTKEIVVKFIETGRISPTGFPDVFRSIYQAVDETVKQSSQTESPGDNDGEAA